MMALNWRNDAACRAHDPELFFPVGDGPATDRHTDAAKAVCAGCPVTAQCLAWAQDTGQDHGVWGGTTPGERRTARAREAGRVGDGTESSPTTAPLRREEDGTLTRPGTADTTWLRDLRGDGLNVRSIEHVTGYERNIVAHAIRT